MRYGIHERVSAVGSDCHAKAPSPASILCVSELLTMAVNRNRQWEETLGGRKEGDGKWMLLRRGVAAAISEMPYPARGTHW